MIYKHEYYLFVVCSYVINDGISIVLDSKYIKYKYTINKQIKDILTSQVKAVGSSVYMLMGY